MAQVALAREISRSFILERHADRIEEFDEFVLLSDMMSEEISIPKGAQKFSDFPMLEAVIVPLVTSVITGYLGNLLFYYFGPGRRRKARSLDGPGELEAVTASLREPRIRNRAAAATTKRYRNEEIVLVILQFADTYLEESTARASTGSAPNHAGPGHLPEGDPRGPAKLPDH
jgi:hypothetical protein